MDSIWPCWLNVQATEPSFFPEAVPRCIRYSRKFLVWLWSKAIADLELRSTLIDLACSCFWSSAFCAQTLKSLSTLAKLVALLKVKRVVNKMVEVFIVISPVKVEPKNY